MGDEIKIVKFILYFLTKDQYTLKMFMLSPVITPGYICCNTCVDDVSYDKLQLFGIKRLALSSCLITLFSLLSNVYILNKRQKVMHKHMYHNNYYNNPPNYVTKYISDFLSRVMGMVFNITFNNISAILWWSVLLADETGVPEENHRPVSSH